ncbi:MAG: hypothetical protein JXA67_07330, partial [Micromonosporaceae bacterium]|nr:hypothetical protein [Micromonosporaceae bacterium]
HPAQDDATQEPTHPAQDDATQEPTHPAQEEEKEESDAPAHNVVRALPTQARRRTVAVCSGGSARAGLPAAYDALVVELGREPSGAELGRAAGCDKATANRWKAAMQGQSQEEQEREEQEVA